MKKLLTLTLLLILSTYGYAQQQTTRRTLIEEFTSSSADQSAVSDPVINQLEGEAATNFCIVKWYLPWGTVGADNRLAKDYPLSVTRSQGYYHNDTVSTIILNGSKRFNPYKLSLDTLRNRVSSEYSKTSPFIVTVTQQEVGDSVIALVYVRQLDTAVDLTKLSIGVILTERYAQYTDANHFPYHTNVVRTVLPSLDPKTGEIRDALPFAFVMAGQTEHTFRFAAKIGASWDRYGLASVAVIQDNSTKEVLQCNWTVPEIQFMRPTTNTFIMRKGKTPMQFQLRNLSDEDITITPQLTHNAPADWILALSGMDYPTFVLKAHSSVTGTFIAQQTVRSLHGSGEFILHFRAKQGIIVASISGTLVGDDSRDLIIKNWASAVYQSDPDIIKWKEFGLDAAIVNDDAIGDLFNDNLRRFRTVYVQRSNYGDSVQLETIRDYMSAGGRMIFNSNSVLKYFSNSIVDTTADKYAVNFKSIFRTIPTGIGSYKWSKGNVVASNVFADTLTSPFTAAQRFVEPLVPTDTFAKPMIFEHGGSTVGMAIESQLGKIAYLTFPISDIQNPTQAGFITDQILRWFKTSVSDVKEPSQENSDIVIYPNPASNSATVTSNYLQINDHGVIMLHDVLGNDVTHSLRTADGKCYIDCTSLPAGTYTLSIRSKDRLEFRKFIVAR